MQPKRRAGIPASSASHGGKVVASFTVGESASVGSAPAPLPAVIEGRIQSSSSSGPFVEWSGSAAPRCARVLWMENAPDWSKCAGLRVALAFEGGDEARPIVVGLLEAPPAEARKPVELASPEVWAPETQSSEKPEVLRIESGRELRIECGKASIHLRADGRLELRGEYLISRASGPNKIKGGSVQIN